MPDRRASNTLQDVAEKVLRADARRNLELILRAAGECFAERGLEASVADVAARAGVGTATIFRRFPTKDDLIDAVIAARMEEMVAVVREAAEQPAGIATIRELLRGVVALQLRDRGFVDSVGKGRFADVPGYAAIRDEMFGALSRVVVQAKAAGELRDDVEPGDLPVVMHMLAHAAQLVDGDRAWHRYLDLAIDGLRPGAAHPLSHPAPAVEQFEHARTARGDC